MDIVTLESVKIPNSVIVSGLTMTEVDNELPSYLETHGSVNRVLSIDDPGSEFHGSAIVEFSYGTAMQSLTPVLPFTYKSPTRPDVTFQVRALSSVYSPAASHSATSAYVSELQAIAKMAGKSFELVLQDELAKLSSVTGTSAESVPPGGDDGVGSVLPPLSVTQLSCGPTSTIESPVPTSKVLNSGYATIPEQNLTKGPPLVKSPVTANSYVHLTTNDINPPEVQKVVVEHIVRNEEASPYHYASSRLRAFSGRLPRPKNEADYETWRSSVELLLTDPTLSDLNQSRKIVESLLPPASDFTKHLGSQASQLAYLKLLDSAYGTVEDGDELFARFLGTLQNAGEKTKPPAISVPCFREQTV